MCLEKRSLIKKWAVQIGEKVSHRDLEWFKPLLKRPQECQGCINDQEDPWINAMVCFCANIQPKLNKLQKTSKIVKKRLFFGDFSNPLQSRLNITMGLILGSFRSF